MFQYQPQYSVAKASLRIRLKQLAARCLQKLPILDTGGAYLLAGAATETAIDVAFE